jgi:hypothetical protein
MLREAISAFDRTQELDRESAGSPSTIARRRQTYGKRGVARLFLSRGPDAVESELQSAIADLDVAESLGDTSPQHFEYVLESLCRLYDISADADVLTRAATLSSSLQSQSALGRDLLYGVASVVRRVAIAECASDRTQAESSFRQAIELASHGMNEPYSGRGIEQRSFHALIGELEGRLFKMLSEVSESDSLLDSALHHLELAHSDDDPYPGLALPFVLLEKAKRIRASNLLEALHLLRKSKEICRQSGGEPTPLENDIDAELVATEIWQSLECDNLDRLASALREAIDSSHRIINYAAIAHAARRLVRIEGYAPIVFAVSTILEDAFHQSDGNVFLASNSATLKLILAKQERDIELLTDAAKLFEKTCLLHPEGGTRELCGNYGDACYWLGREHYLRNDIAFAIACFEDSIVQYERALMLSTDMTNPVGQTTFTTRITHSRIGSALLWIHRLSNRRMRIDLIQKAIEHLETSHLLGNDDPSNYGLLADAYHVLGRSLQSVDFLRRAAILKEDARTAGEVSRENPSVSARIHFRIWELTREHSELTRAISLSLQSAKRDPSWAWPWLQLSEMCESAGNNWQVAITSIDSVPQSDFGGALRAGNWKHLLIHACQLALSTEEFRAARVGSGGRQQGVYVLDDPHALLSKTIVFKRTDRASAHREMASCTAFRSHLQNTGAPWYIRVAEPIDVVDSNEFSTYVMRRVNGQVLGTIAVDDTADPGEVHQAYLRCAEALAHFHVWSCSSVQGAKRSGLEGLLSSLQDSCAYLDLPQAMSRQVIDHFRLLVPSDLPQVRKKDAHPENWIISGNGDVFVIDFESSTYLPLLFELVLLIEDYPAFTVGDWQSRLPLVSAYGSILSEHEPSYEEFLDVSQDTYNAFALLVSINGLARYSRRARKMHSTSARRYLGLRVDHYLAWIRSCASQSNAILELESELRHNSRLFEDIGTHWSTEESRRR